jgi:predicted site-specific integrase-resolvase
MPATATAATRSTGTVAPLAGVAPDAMRQWVRDGRLPRVETPLGRRIGRGDVAALVAERGRARPERFRL